MTCTNSCSLPNSKTTTVAETGQRNCVLGAANVCKQLLARTFRAIHLSQKDPQHKPMQEHPEKYKEKAQTQKLAHWHAKEMRSCSCCALAPDTQILLGLHGTKTYFGTTAPLLL